MTIHPTAIIEPGARLAEGVAVGPYSVIGGHVEIGAGTSVGSHCVIAGHTRIGRNNRIYHFVSLGEAPQDKKYAGEPTRLEIGDGNTIREFCSFNTGTVQDAGTTRVGDDNWIMAYVHIAHDCQVGSHTIFANNASLAGHVHVGDYAILAGFTGAHQFCRIGAHSFVGHGVLLAQDLPPYVMVAGVPPAPRGINSEGLRRRGFSAEALAGIKQAYRILYRSGLALEAAAVDIAREAESCPELKPLAEFLATPGRGIVR
jgi:UDP-N-acetylglucosamine acyltransferase